MERQVIPRHTIDFLVWSPPMQATNTDPHSFPLYGPLWLPTQIPPALVPELRPLMHIFHNPKFPPGQDINAFQWWTNKGLFRIGHLFSMGPLAVTNGSNGVHRLWTKWEESPFYTRLREKHHMQSAGRGLWRSTGKWTLGTVCSKELLR